MAIPRLPLLAVQRCQECLYREWKEELAWQGIEQAVRVSEPVLERLLGVRRGYDRLMLVLELLTMSSVRPWAEFIGWARISPATGTER